MKHFLLAMIFLTACIGNDEHVPPTSGPEWSDADSQLPADTPEPPECSPFWQIGCPLGEEMTCLDSSAGAFCVKSGSKLHSQRCEGVNDCRPKLACLYVPETGDHRCLDYCDYEYNEGFAWECSRFAGQPWDNWGTPGYDPLADRHLGVWKLKLWGE